MDELQKELMLFFDRPTEPIFIKKGIESLNIPTEFYPKEYADLITPQPEVSVETVLRGRSFVPTPLFASERGRAAFSPTNEVLRTVQSPSIEHIVLPDLSIPMGLHRDENFTFFLPNHRQMAGKLIDIFMGEPDIKKLVELFTYCQMNMNPYLFNYCASVAILHRPDTKGISLPTFAETFPGKFVNQKTFRNARENISITPESKPVHDIDITLPVDPLNPEQRLTYFREDVGVNSHHWHWHLIYPNEATNTLIVNKDRRGELFYYMHHQVMARYNVERMCNELPVTKPFMDFREPIEEGYFPELDSGNAKRIWPPRFDNIKLQDVHRASISKRISLADMEEYRDRILSAAKSQTIQQMDGSVLTLDEETGIDILGNLMESTTISYNPVYYGDYHNDGHMLIAYAHDPQEYHSQEYSVMGDTATAMRDPVFYRWHAGIDQMFTVYKDSLTPYGTDKLSFNDIYVTSINIQDPSGQSTHNTISTLWERSTLNLFNGLDFAKRRNVYARITHLQHEEFMYMIGVNNKSGRPQTGTVRIFLAPTVDETGRALSFEEQRKLVIEMDKFSQHLSPGENTIRRRSNDSSVTIPFERIFRDRSSESKKSSPAHFCDCGWPQYLLVPKGTEEGFPMMIFVMISNWDEDKVDRDLTGADNDNASYCGLRDSKYPDRRAMGFPFDRKPASGVNSFTSFLQPNMAVNKCIIKFIGRTRDRDQNKSDEEKKLGDKKQ